MHLLSYLFLEKIERNLNIRKNYKECRWYVDDLGIYKTVCLLLWGRGAASVTDHGKWFNESSARIFRARILLARIFSSRILSDGIRILKYTCGHPKPVFLWLQKLSVQRDLHIKCCLCLKFIWLPKTSSQEECWFILTSSITHFTCISVW